jgi:nickel-dependent lactate racemase
MKQTFLYGKEEININVPDNSILYKSDFPAPAVPAGRMVRHALNSPAGCPPLSKALQKRAKDDVVIVTSDITRPVPYTEFLPDMLSMLETGGVARENILILIATGMHRPSTAQERIEMFGKAVAENYRIMDHKAEDESSLIALPEKSCSGASIKLNKHYVQAGFKIITALVEPHFMAGFSGGRKAVCPGLASLETIEKFHGYDFLSNPLARNGNILGNPLHEEALSVARIAGVDFSLNVVLDSHRRVVNAFAGTLCDAHSAATAFVRSCACPQVKQAADVILTSSGGYPLDATFYQCVKGLVSCLPAVRARGTVISFGMCDEGIGSPEYTALMKKYSNRYQAFLDEIKKPEVFLKDQWEFQMHTRVLEKVGQENLHFFTGGIGAEGLACISVNGHSVPLKETAREIEKLLQSTLGGDKILALIPEGPYCTPLGD